VVSVSHSLGTIALVLALGLLVYVLAVPTRIPSRQVRLNYVLLSSVMLLGGLHNVVTFSESTNLIVSGISLALSIIVFWRFMVVRVP